MAAPGEFGLRPSASSERLLDTTPAPPAHPKGVYAMEMEGNGALNPLDIDDAETPRTAHRTNRRHAAIAGMSMLLLVLQGTVLSIVLRYSRIKRGRKYLPSVAGESTFFFKKKSPPHIRRRSPFLLLLHRFTAQLTPPFSLRHSVLL